jgi:murein DD-endopeptidase MepM/ murein hydrolase activator NlpD
MSRARPHRRRARDEVLAPWVAAAVILGGWGLAARFIAPEIPVPPPRAPGAGVVETASPSDRPDTPLHAVMSPPPETGPAAHASTGDEASSSVPATRPVPADPVTSLDIAALRERNLLVPVAGVERTALASSFSDARGSTRVHEALDVLAPRGTPVVAVEAGTIVKLFRSVRGGTTIYQFDPTGAFCYYYAHLDSYEPGLKEGKTVERGETIGYVGTTGNAPPGTPHLHFAILRLGPERQWWEGEPIDPYLVLR